MGGAATASRHSARLRAGGGPVIFFDMKKSAKGPVVRVLCLAALAAAVVTWAWVPMPGSSPGEGLKKGATAKTSLSKGDNL